MRVCDTASMDSATPTKEAVLAELQELMDAEFGMAPEEVQLSRHLFDELDLDSIDMVDLAVLFEERRRLKLDEDGLREVQTVEDAVNLMHAAYAGRGAGAPSSQHAGPHRTSA
jgi:acyl carrier protein